MVNVLWKQTAFPLWSAVVSCWNRKLVSLASPVTSLMRLPISWISSIVCWCHLPAVSTAMEDVLVWQITVLLRFPWPPLISCSTDFLRCIWSRYDCAQVFSNVTSHANALPLDHGIMVAPSGRLPFCHIIIIIILLFNFVNRIISRASLTLRYYRRTADETGVTAVKIADMLLCRSRLVILVLFTRSAYAASGTEIHTRRFGSSVR